jgi:hypothetical protein
MMETEAQSSITTEERKTARNWYFWLWLSPMLAVPTVVSIYLGLSYLEYEMYRQEYHFGLPWLATLSAAIFGSAAWHLILLIPALDKRPFVSWHGKQALLLAAIRTALPLFFGIVFGEETGFLLVILPLLVVWFFGTLWGQLEATRGKCTLMRWFGRGGRQFATKPKELSADELVKIVRFSSNPEERTRALRALEKLGMTEPL